MFRFNLKKYSICVAFLLLFLLAGCGQKTQEASTETVDITTTEKATQAPVSLDGTWAAYNIRETIERLLVYSSLNDEGGLKMVNFLTPLIRPELIIKGNDVQYHIAYNNTDYFKLDYELNGKNFYSSYDEFMNQNGKLIQSFWSKLQHGSGGYNEDMSKLDLTIKDGTIDPTTKTIKFPHSLFITPSYILNPNQAVSETTYEYTIEGDILTLKVSGLYERDGYNRSYTIQFKKQ